MTEVTMLSALKRKTKSLTMGHFWLRYSTLAAYRAICATASTLSGRTTSGATATEHDTDEAVAYVRKVFHNYKTAAGVQRFHGRVAEVGPGAGCGVGLMFLSDGCEHADLVDRFFSRRDERHQQAINRALVREFPQLASFMRDGDFSEQSFPSLARHYGGSAAAETFFEIHKGYDAIVSCAVLEHAYDPLRAVSAMASALNPGGMMLHQVDCRDHGQFSERFHELKFLEPTRLLYAPLKWGGGPNRVRLGAYLDALRPYGLDLGVYITGLAGIQEQLPPGTTLDGIPGGILEGSRRFVGAVRRHLAPPFRDLPDEDLMITSFLLTAKKA